MVRTGVSGAVAAIVDFASLIAFVELVAIPVAFASFVATALGAIGGFLLSKLWAFEDRSPISSRQVVSYGAVSAGTATLVAASMHVLVVVLGAAYVLAKIIAAVAIFALWSYPAQARWVFAKGQPHAA